MPQRSAIAAASSRTIPIAGKRKKRRLDKRMTMFQKQGQEAQKKKKKTSIIKTSNQAAPTFLPPLT